MLSVLLVVTAILVIAATGECYAYKTGVPTVASYPSARRKIIALLKRDHATRPLGQPYTVIDLGSGTGVLALKIARALPQAQVLGIEISFFPWLCSRLLLWVFSYRNLKFKKADFWNENFGQADVVVIYVTGNIMARLSAKLQRELKPGALVIANDAMLQGDWAPFAAEDNKLFGVFASKIYSYRKD